MQMFGIIDKLDPGSYLTCGNVNTPGIFAIPANQVLYNILSKYDKELLMNIMPNDGANYISFN